MTPYPVHYHVERPARLDRLQLLIRIVAFAALGLLGLSFGTVFFFAYLALPAFAAIRLSSESPRYLDDDGPRIVQGLSWLAAVSAWAGLLTDRLPSRSPVDTVSLQVEGTARAPTPVSAIWRILTGLPSALVLGILCWVGCFVWLWAALSILFVQRVGPGAFHYLEGLQRWSVRLLAYQASLVDEYPPFSFEEAPAALPPAVSSASP
jgi:hypothetical protein